VSAIASAALVVVLAALVARLLTETSGIQTFQSRRMAWAPLVLIVALLVAPLAATAQQAGKPYRLGYLSPRAGIETPDEDFRQGLRELGYVEGQNLVMDWRFAKGRIAAFPGLANEIVRLNPDCILTIGLEATRVAKQATATIPIVMGTGDDDPVQRGLIASFAKPGANVTGIVNLGSELAGKRLQLLKELVPQAARVAILWSPPGIGGFSGHFRESQEAARALGIRLQSLEVRTADGLEHAFESAVQGRAEALIVVGTGLMSSHRARIIGLAAKTRLPAIYTHEWAREGGLMSYASNRAAQARRAASYVDRIFKGAKPADLPVEQPTKFDLVVNLRTARALGLTMPAPLLGRADHVIPD
jgi:putative ABC transport system substrate-binding protein